MANDSNELNSLFEDDDIPKGNFRPDDYTFHLKPRGLGPFREKYRPQKFDELVPTFSVEQLRNQVDNPGASQIFLLTGLSGLGKTTSARVLARAFICTADNTYDKPCLECKNCKRFDKNPIDPLPVQALGDLFDPKNFASDLCQPGSIEIIGAPDGRVEVIGLFLPEKKEGRQRFGPFRCLGSQLLHLAEGRVVGEEF